MVTTILHLSARSNHAVQLPETLAGESYEMQYQAELLLGKPETVEQEWNKSLSVIQKDR
jgi:predicted short-subunit dehydrogenase-like oxidoreductase (DUF2520 family)